jgi:hypothetical protein
MVNIETPKKMAIKICFFFLLTACYPANIAVSFCIVFPYIKYTAAVERELVHRAVYYPGIVRI